MAEKNRTLVIVAVLIAAVLFFNNAGFFGITLLSPQTQYYNQDILVKFESNLTSPVITAFFNDEKLCEEIETGDICGTIDELTCPSNLECMLESNVSINGTCIDTTCSLLDFSKDVVNGSFVLRLSVEEEGVFKFVAKQNNITEIETIEVRQPFVGFVYDIPTLVSKGESANFIIKTQNPQGESMEADSVDIIVFDPDDKETTLFLTKSVDTFTINFNYEKAGGYQFKVQPRKQGFATVERTVLTNVITTGGIHPVIYIWIIALVIWIILFAIRRFRK